MTGIVGLLPDPHLVGAGYSIIRNGKELGCHYDFNWNDRIRLHRKLTSLLYITPDWKEEWGGHIQYWDDNIDVNPKSNLIESVAPKFNRLVINENVKHAPYHRVSEVKAPEDVPRCAIRFFYYISRKTNTCRCTNEDSRVASINSWPRSSCCHRSSLKSSSTAR